MQKWIVTALGALTVASVTMSGCGSPAHQNGYIDKTGALVLDVDKLTPKPLAIGDYSEELAALKYPDKVRVIDKNGQTVFEKPFKTIRTFSEGRAAFSTGSSDSDQKWGYVNTKGDITIKAIYDEVQPFSEGLAAVRLSKDKANGKDAGRWIYIDDSGTRALQDSFEEAGPFSEGFAAVRQNKRMGSINRQGAFVVPCEYDMVYKANDGMIVAAQGKGLSGPEAGQMIEYFDKNGNKITHKEIHPVTLKNLSPMLWTTNTDKALARPLSTFVTPGFCETKSIAESSGKFFIEQQFSARAFAGSFDYIFPVSDGYFVAYSDAGGGKMDYRGGVPEDASGIWNNKQFRFYDAAPFSNGMGLVQETKGGNYGYIDKTANYALKPIYEHARSFKNDRAVVGEMALHDMP